MFNSIKIAHLNAQSVKNKLFEINEFVNSEQIDILSFNETFLDPQKDFELNLLMNYKFIRNDRPTFGGGSGFYIHKRIKFNVTHLQNESEFELTSVEIDVNSEKFQILKIYTHPKSKTDLNFLENLIRNKNKTIVLGDFNATHESWYCTSNNYRGYILDEIISNHNLIIHNNTTPTSKKSTNIIDLCISTSDLHNSILNFTVHKTFHPSDHFPISFDLKVKKFNNIFKKIDWDSFKKELDFSLKYMQTEIESQNQLDETIN